MAAPWAAPVLSPCPSMDAGIALQSPEAARRGLTLTNAAQKLRRGRCKLFRSSREKRAVTAFAGGRTGL